VEHMPLAVLQKVYSEALEAYETVLRKKEGKTVNQTRQLRKEVESKDLTNRGVSHMCYSSKESITIQRQ
jgi:hypothetical protein